MQKNPLTTISACLLALGIGGQAQADTVYLYTGNYFNVFWDAPEVPYTYTAGMRVDASVTTIDPLQPDRPYGDVKDLIIAYSFSDGIQTISSARPDALSSFYLSTGPNGEIASWDMSVAIVSPAASPLTSTSGSIHTSSYDQMGMGMYQNDTALIYGSDGTGRGWYDWGYANAAPGTWIKQPASPIPLPPAILLFGSAAVLLGFARRRKTP